MAVLTDSQIITLNSALDANTTATQLTLPKVDASASNAVSLNSAENPIPNSPSNTPIYASGNASAAATGIKKSNATVSHACDSSTYVGMVAKQIGAFGGKIVQAIRDAIKAILAYFGVNPSSSGITSQLKKIAQYIKDKAKFIKEISDAINGYIVYLNALKQLLQYILSLPARLLAYFKDCISTIQKQIVAGFKSALDNTPDPTSSALSDAQNAFKDVQSSVTQFQQSLQNVVAASSSLVTAATSLSQTPTSNTQAQAEATQQVFAAAGFSQGNIQKI